ncbi:hypothetical protein JCM10212_005954 [Sporobolomyces blumeae]
MSAVTNYSFYAVPAIWVVGISSHFYAISLTKTCKDLPDFTNVNPREFLRRVQNQEKRTPVVDEYLRAESANANTFENWPIFAAAVVAGNLARLPVRYMNLFAGGYVLSRVLFATLYIKTTSEKWSNLRSLVYVAGIGSIFTTFIKAGNAFQSILL